jgi:hypothetical protein
MRHYPWFSRQQDDALKVASLAPLSVSFVGGTTRSDGNWVNHAIGAVPDTGERRFVVVVLDDYIASGWTDFTLGGVSMGTPILTQLAGGAGAVLIYMKELNTGTTATIAMVGGSPNIARVDVYRVIARSGVRVAATSVDDTNNLSMPINVVRGGVLIGGCQGINISAHTWSGGPTRDDSTDLNTNEWSSCGSMVNADNGSVTVGVSISSGSLLCGGVVALAPQ